MGSAALFRLTSGQLVLDGLADELGPTMRSHERVDPIHDGLGQAHLRRLQMESWPSHATARRRRVVFRQGGHLTISPIACVSGIAYGYPTSLMSATEQAQ